MFHNHIAHSYYCFIHFNFQVIRSWEDGIITWFFCLSLNFIAYWVEFWLANKHPTYLKVSPFHNYCIVGRNIPPNRNYFLRVKLGSAIYELIHPYRLSCKQRKRKVRASECTSCTLSWPQCCSSTCFCRFGFITKIHYLPSTKCLQQFSCPY